MSNELKDGWLQTEASSGKVKDEEGKNIKVPFQYYIGKTLTESIECFGEEVVNDLFIAAAKVRVQNQVRNQLEAGKPIEAIQKDIQDYVLGQDSTDPYVQVVKGMDKLTAEQRQAILDQLQAGN